jgi:uncharacterized protein with PIN domain
VTVVVRRTCRDRREAETLRAAVVADNPPYVTVTAEGHELVVRLTAPSAASARTTLEDLLACLKVAERTVSAAGPS